MSGSAKFEVKDKVLAYHNGQLYHASVKDVKVEANETVQYFIHYNLFKATWDEWLPEDKVIAGSFVII